MRALDHRISNVSFSFESSADPHNVAAAMRTLEGLGFDEMDQIYADEIARPNGRVVAGAWKWLQLNGYDSLRTWKQARSDHKIWVSTLLPQNLDTGIVQKSLLDWTPAAGPTTFVFGNEHTGVSSAMIAAADVCFSIPMLGMVESFNLSVAAALTAFHVRNAIGWKETTEYWLPADAKKYRQAQWFSKPASKES